MKLIVSSRFGMSIVDTNNQEITDPFPEFLAKTFSPYGISWNQDYLFVALRPHGGLGFERIGVFDKQFNFVKEIVKDKMKFSDLHQILFYDGKLWVCSPGRNQITIVDPDTGSYEIWLPNSDMETVVKDGRPPRDYNHFNSIWIKGDRLYLVAHNFERPAEIWEFTYPQRELVKKTSVGKCAHNVFVDGGKITTLNSKDNEYYKRGLARSKYYEFTGSSSYIENREERQKSLQGSVQVINRKDGLSVVEKEIPINKGEVYEIRLLNEPDLAHNEIVWQPKF